MTKTLRARLYLGFGFCAFLIVVVVGCNLLALRNLEELYHISEKRAADMEMAAGAAHSGEDLYRTIADSIINGYSPESQRRWEAVKTAIQLKVQRLMAVADTQEEYAQVAQATASIYSVISTFEQEILPLLRGSKGLPGPVGDLDAKIDRQIDSVVKSLHITATSMSRESSDAAREFHSVLNDAIVVGVVISLVGIAAVVFISFQINRKIIRPLNEMTSAADQVRDGDYSLKLGYMSCDEVGELADALRDMSEQVARRTTALEEANQRLYHEIYERQQMAEELGRTCERLTDTLESISDGFLSVDTNGVLVYFNAAAERLLGRQRQEVLGRNIFDAFPEVRNSVIEEHASRSPLGRETHTFEAYFDREPYVNWYEVRIYPRKDGTSAYFQVISERKRVEAALRESEEKFRTIFENASDGIVIIDPETVQFMSANSRFSDMIGQQPADIRTLTVRDIHPPELSVQMEQEFRKHANGSVPNSSDVPVLRKDGTIFYAEITSSLVTLSGKRYLMSNFRDISERKRAEEALRESEEKFRQLAENIQTVFWIQQIDSSRLIYVSPTCHKVFEISRESLINGWKGWLRRVAAEDRHRVLRSFREAVEDGVEFRYTMDNGELRWVWARTFPIRNSSGTVYRLAGIAEDITLRKLAELKINDQQQQLLEFNRILWRRYRNKNDGGTPASG